jgi:HD-like signal output (HDOD) protein
MILPKEIQHQISKIENIATLPDVALKVLEAIQDSQSNMNQISKIIEKDASIAARLLKVANSPYWGFSGKIDNIQRSLVLLGLREVSNIIIAVSIFTAFTKLKPKSSFDRDNFWLHASGTGQIARRFAKNIQLNFQGEEFVAALIHDLGKLILDQFFSEEFKQILTRSQESGSLPMESEEKFFGFNHSHIAAWLLKRWNIPESIVYSVNYHHVPQEASEHQPLVAVVHLSDIICEKWGIGSDSDVKNISLKENSAWDILVKYRPELSELDLDKFTDELKIEIENDQLFMALISD